MIILIMWSSGGGVQVMLLMPSPTNNVHEHSNDTRIKSHLVILIHIGSATDEQLQHVNVPVGCSEQQRRLPVVALARDVGVVLQQQPARGQLTVVRGPNQRREAVRISLVQFVEMVLDVRRAEFTLCGELVDRSLAQM